MDRIIISDLLVRCIIGVNEDERREKQDVLINLILFADLGKPGRSDRLEDSIDYKTVKKKILKAVEDSRFHLIEALAERVAGICLENQMVSKVQVKVEKPSALRFARSVGVEIMRERQA